MSKTDLSTDSLSFDKQLFLLLKSNMAPKETQGLRHIRHHYHTVTSLMTSPKDTTHDQICMWGNFIFDICVLLHFLSSSKFPFCGCLANVIFSRSDADFDFGLNFDLNLRTRIQSNNMAECCGITIKQIGALAFTFVLSAFWSTVMTFKMIYDIFRNGWDSFSYRKARTQPPEVLTKGWNHDYVKLSNVTLHYVSSGSRDKPLMLFLHGFPEFWYSWRHQMREFQDDYRVVAVDMRGYGQSDKPSGRFNYKIEVLAQDVNELVHSLGYNSCILVAHDWGGAVAWNTASYYPEIVDKLIIMNCPNNQAFGKHLSKSRTQLLKSWYMFFFQCPCLPEFFMRAHDYKFIEDVFRGPESGCRNPHAFSDEDIEAWKYTFSQPGALTPPINYYRAAFTRCDRPPSPASNIINPPTLIIWGTKDVALETPLAALSAEFCRDATVKYIEGASHWVQQDEPALCSSYMRKFLTKDD